MSEYRTWESSQREYMERRPERVSAYLAASYEESLTDGEWASFLFALRVAIDASGGVAAMAKKLGCSRTSLYKSLAANGNPRFDTVHSILRELGLRVSLEPISPSRQAKAKPPASGSRDLTRPAKSPKVRAGTR